MSLAARTGDPTNHGGLIVGPGIPTVLIGGMPAAAMGEGTTCPVQLPSGVPHGSSVVTSGSPTVLIGGRPAARLGDETGCGAVIVQGCPSVIIGG